MDSSEHVVNHVRSLRRSKTLLTQEDLAEQIGVSRQTVIAIEKGKYNPSVGLALKIAHVFDVAVESLFELESED